MDICHDALSEKFNIILFCPSKSDPYLRIQDAWYHYDYINAYYDELLVFRKDIYLTVLNYLFTIKGVIETEFYLDGSIRTAEINEKAIYDFSSRNYIKNMIEKIEKIFETIL